MDLDYFVLLVFAPVLVLTGIAGFIIPPDKSLTSGTPAYNIFHIIFGLVGIGIVFSGHEPYMRVFNVGFGLIDLYQAAASWMGWFPAKHFAWKKADDILHVVIGLILVSIGLFF